MSFATTQFGGTSTYPPPSLVELDARRLQQADQHEARDEAETAERDAAALAKAEAADREQRIAQGAAPYETMEVPDAETLGIDVAQLPASRAELVRFAAWVGDLRRQVADLEQGREVFLASIHAPIVTAAALAELEAQDRSGFVGWLKSGGKVDRPVVRTFEREQLQAKLKTDTYEGQVASKALTEAEEAIDVLHRAVEVLERRRQGLVDRAMVEHAVADGIAYVTAIRDLEVRLATLLGLATLTGIGSDFFRGYGEVAYETDPPRFVIPGAPSNLNAPDELDHWGKDRKPRVRVDAKRAAAAAAPWRGLRELWSRDPMAEPSAGRGEGT